MLYISEILFSSPCFLMTDLKDLFDVQNSQENKNKIKRYWSMKLPLHGHKGVALSQLWAPVSIHSLNDQRTFPLVIIFLILIMYLLYNVLITLRENRC